MQTIDLDTLPRLSHLTRAARITEGARDAAVLIAARAMHDTAPALALKRFQRLRPHSQHHQAVEDALLGKAAVPVGTTSDWDLLPTPLSQFILDAGAAASVLARLGLVEAPLDTRIPVESATSSAVVSWVGQGGFKPVGQLSLETKTLAPLKAAGLLVISAELLRAATPVAIDFLTSRLAVGLAALVDASAFDPVNTGAPGAIPPSFTSGGTPASVTGAAPAEDVAELVRVFVANGGRLEQAAFVLGSTTAVLWRLTGHEAFRELTPTGGRIAGVDAIASDAVGSTVAILDRSRAVMGDGSAVRIDAAAHADILLDDGGGSGPTRVNLWQANLRALRAEVYRNWFAAEGAVAYFTYDYTTT